MFGLKQQGKGKEPWWHTSIHPENSSCYIAHNPLVKGAIWNRTSVHQGWHNGSPDLTLPELAEKFVESFPSFMVSVCHYGPGTTPRIAVLTSELGAVAFEKEGEQVSSSGSFCEAESLVEWKKFCQEHLPEAKKPGQVEALVRPGPDKPLKLINAGRVYAPLTEDNYTDEVLEGFRAVLDDINSDTPNGRIAIFDGPPGTGKTYLLRALTLECPEVAFVIIPSDLISEIGGPEMTNLLMENSDSARKKTVLLVEDADMLLNKRKATNMASIANALNIGDGLMGEVFKLFIVATSNTPVKQIDPALRRPGRLSRLVSVGPLPAEKAIKTFKSLLPEAEAPAWTNPMTLAEVYEAAKKAGWKPVKAKPGDPPPKGIRYKYNLGELA